MGLREEKGARTREQIVASALELFLEQGYDATTMEEVASAARIGTSTLYRYFATKDLLVLDPLSLSGHLGEGLRERPADEPLDLALGHALEALIVAPRADDQRLRRITAVVRGSTVLQARLVAQLSEERTLLADALADRLGRPAGDAYCVFTARVATTALELVMERAATSADDLADRPDRVVALTRDIMDELRREPLVLPRLEP